MKCLEFLFASLILCAALVGEPVDDRAELIKSQPDAGFFFPYVLYVPDDLKTGSPVTLVVETNNTGAQDDFESTVADTIASATGNDLGPRVARHLRQPLLMPVFPRTKTDWKVYTHALDRDTMGIHEGELKRLDRQLLAMVEDAHGRLRARGLVPDSRFLMCGFSASGSFANRFAFLHPDRLMGVVTGGINAFPMLPVSEVSGKPLPFPLGVQDIETFTGQPFQLDEWKALPQMIFMGALDDNDALKFADAYSDEEREIVFSIIGKPMHERWLKAQAIYLSQSPNANLITYGQVGHWTNRQIGMDIINFLESARSGSMAESSGTD